MKRTTRGENKRSEVNERNDSAAENGPSGAETQIQRDVRDRMIVE